MADDIHLPIRVQGTYSVCQEGAGTVTRSERGKRTLNYRCFNEEITINGRPFKQTRREVLRKMIADLINRANTLVAPASTPLSSTIEHISEHNHEALSTHRNRGGRGGSSLDDITRQEDDCHRYSRNSRQYATAILPDGPNIREPPTILLSEPYPEGPPEGRSLVSYGVHHVGTQTKYEYSRKTAGLAGKDGNVAASHIVERNYNARGTESTGGATAENREGDSWTDTCKCGRRLRVIGGSSWAGTCHCGRSLLMSDACKNITVRERWTCRGCAAWNSDMNARECDLCCHVREVSIKPSTKNAIRFRSIGKGLPALREREISAQMATKHVSAPVATGGDKEAGERAGAREGFSPTASAPSSNDVSMASAVVVSSATKPSSPHQAKASARASTSIASFMCEPFPHGASIGALPSSPSLEVSTSVPAASASRGFVTAARSSPEKISTPHSPATLASNAESNDGSTPATNVVARDVTTASTASPEAVVTGRTMAPGPAASAGEFTLNATIVSTMSGGDAANVSAFAGSTTLNAVAATSAPTSVFGARAAVGHTGKIATSPTLFGGLNVLVNTLTAPVFSASNNTTSAIPTVRTRQETRKTRPDTQSLVIGATSNPNNNTTTAFGPFNIATFGLPIPGIQAPSFTCTAAAEVVTGSTRFSTMLPPPPPVTTWQQPPGDALFDFSRSVVGRAGITGTQQSVGTSVGGEIGGVAAPPADTQEHAFTFGSARVLDNGPNPTVPDGLAQQGDRSLGGFKVGIMTSQQGRNASRARRIPRARRSGRGSDPRPQ